MAVLYFLFFSVLVVILVFIIGGLNNSSKRKNRAEEIWRSTSVCKACGASDFSILREDVTYYDVEHTPSTGKKTFTENDISPLIVIHFFKVQCNKCGHLMFEDYDDHNSTGSWTIAEVLQKHGPLKFELIDNSAGIAQIKKLIAHKDNP